MEAENTTPKRLEDLERKDKFTGKVVKVTLAGAIVDIGLEVPGIVHISQLADKPVNRVEDVIEVGQTVEVWVRRVFPKKNRLELTMIEPLGLEWREIKDGMVIKGTVTRLEKYGAFVEIGAERPGLVHISELAHGFIRTPGEAVSEGEEVEVKVLSVNRRRKQIKLSVKALLEEPIQEARKAEKEAVADDDEEDNKPVPTAMEMALREAMERSQQNAPVPAKTPKKSKMQNQELDHILNRTLEQKVNSSTK
ncbi:MAG: S1 RNA-binding domain-containing protein [Anaerolineales bacterium]|nr:S1 RNA-binding domain-containing protein [Anaerolineales bacterium]